MPLIMVAPYRKIVAVVKNILTKLMNSGPYASLSADGLTITSSSGSGARSNVGKSSGKWYWEITLVRFSPYGTRTAVIGPWIGVTALTFRNSLVSYSTITQSYDNHCLLDCSSLGGYSYIIVNRVVNNRAPASAQGDVMGIALDLDAGTLQFYRNGVKADVLQTLVKGATYYPYISDDNNHDSGSMQAIVNFGASAFKYPAPNGFTAGFY